MAFFKGDVPSAGCYSSPEVCEDYRIIPHTWSPVGGDIEVCRKCGGMRTVEREHKLQCFRIVLEENT